MRSQRIMSTNIESLSNFSSNDNALTKRNLVPNSIESFRIFPSCPEEEIIISGAAGRYPSCDNAEDFRHNLYNQVRFQQYSFNSFLFFY